MSLQTIRVADVVETTRHTRRGFQCFVIRTCFLKPVQPLIVKSLRFVNDADGVLYIRNAKLVVNRHEDVETLLRVRQRLFKSTLPSIDQTDVLIFVGETATIR